MFAGSSWANGSWGPGKDVAEENPAKISSIKQSQAERGASEVASDKEDGAGVAAKAPGERARKESSCSHCHGRSNWAANEGQKHNAAKCLDKKKGMPPCPCPRLECGGCGDFTKQHKGVCPKNCSQRGLNPRPNQGTINFVKDV